MKVVARACPNIPELWPIILFPDSHVLIKQLFLETLPIIPTLFEVSIQSFREEF